MAENEIPEGLKDERYHRIRMEQFLADAQVEISTLKAELNVCKDFNASLMSEHPEKTKAFNDLKAENEKLIEIILKASLNYPGGLRGLLLSLGKFKDIDIIQKARKG